MYTAVTAAERGHDVTVWEKSKQIGGQLNLAVVSPGKQEMCKWLTHLNYRAKKAGVKFEFKKEATVENVKEFAPDAVVVCLPNRNIALASLRREGVKSYINSKVLEVTEHEVKIQHKDGTEEWLKGFDYIVLGLGSRKYDPLSEELKAFVPEVHVIGDAIKPGQSSDAMHQGFHVGYEL